MKGNSLGVGAGAGVFVDRGIVWTTVGVAVSVAVGVTAGVGVAAGGLTHPKKANDNTIRIIEINLIFFIPSPKLTSVFVINNIIGLFSDSGL